MAEGVTLNIEKANINAKSLEGIGLSSKDPDNKKLFKKDEQSELLKALTNLPESFRKVLKDTMTVTGQALLKDYFSSNKKSDDFEEPKSHFEKPTNKENDIKKLAAKYGTPALFLGSKIDDIIRILQKPVKEITETKNSPISAASVIVLGSNIEDSKKYIKDFEELTEFIAKQKTPDIGVFKDTQKKLDDLSKSIDKSTKTKVDDKGAEKFTKRMGKITTSFSSIIKQVISLNALTKLVDFKKSNKNLDDLEKYLERLGKMGESLQVFSESIATASSSILLSSINLIKASIFSSPAKKAIQKINSFIEEGLKSLIDTIEKAKLKKTKSMLNAFKDINEIAASLLKTCLIFTAITPVALLGTIGIKTSNIFIKALSSFIEIINDNLSTKEIKKATKAISSMSLLVALTTMSMIVASIALGFSLKAIAGAAAITIFATEIGFALKILNSLAGNIKKGILISILVTTFAGLAFISLKTLSTITPDMTGSALLAILGFVGVMAASAAIGAVATYIVAPLALGLVAAGILALFAITANFAINSLNKIDSKSVDNAYKVVAGGKNKTSLATLFLAFVPLGLVAPLAIAALSFALPAALLIVPFAILTKKAIDNLSSIKDDNIKIAAKNISTMALPLSATSLLSIPAALAIGALPTVIIAISLLALASVPFKKTIELLGNEPFYTEDNPLKAKTGILGFVNTMTLTMGLLGLTAMMAPLAMMGSTLISVVMITLMPAIYIFSKIAKYFNKRAEVNLVDVVFGNNLSKPLQSKYGLIPFINGAIIASKLLWSGTLSFLMGTISAVMMSLFFSTLKKSLDAMDQLIDASRQDINLEAIEKYLNVIELVAEKAGSPGLLKSVGEAVKSWVSEKLGTSTAELINNMTESVGPMRNLSSQLQGINLDGISIFIDALDKIQNIKASSNTKAIKNAIAGVKELTDSIDDVDGNKFNANISSIMPGIEKLQGLPEGDGLSKKAKEIKSAINTIFSAKTGKDADAMISKIDKLTDSLERLSKIDSSNISKTLGTANGTSFREVSRSTVGTETANRNNQTSNINVDNSNIESMLGRILSAINDLKGTKSWTDEAL